MEQYKSLKIRLKPTQQQEKQMSVNSDCARFAYNWTVAKFKEWKKGDKRQSKYDLAKELRYLYNTNEEFAWLKNGCSRATEQAIYDANIALQNFFKYGKGFPKFKNKHRCKPKYYVTSDEIKVGSMHVQLTKLSMVITSEQLPHNVKFYNPRVSFDGKYWYLTVGIKCDEQLQIATGESIGVDLGVKTLATISDGRTYCNPMKSKQAKRLVKKLKRAQRKQSRKYSKEGSHSQNYNKAKRETQLLYRRIANIRKNCCHQLTASLVKTKPRVIVIEDLNVSGMLKNHKLARSIQEVNFYEIRRQLEYKCAHNGIRLLVADRLYPSSKVCSTCGSVKKELSLKERVYHCEHCRASIDRDLNAAINLVKLAA